MVMLSFPPSLSAKRDTTEEPWERADREKAEKAAAEKAREEKISRLKPPPGGKISDAKAAHFNQARVAHAGGVIKSNKIEATFKFLKRKERNGQVLTPAELAIVAQFVGGGEASLAKLEEKAKIEKQENLARQVAKGATGGGANKDMRVPVIKGKKGKKGKKKKAKTFVVEKKKKKESKWESATGSVSLTDRLSGALGTTR